MINYSFRITKTLKDDVVSIHKLDDNLVTWTSCIFASVLINGGMFAQKKNNSKQDTNDIISSQNEFAALLIQLKPISLFFTTAFKTHSSRSARSFLFCSTNMRHTNMAWELL